MKEENKKLLGKLAIFEEEIKKMTEKISNSAQGALAEHLQTNVRKFFEALQQEYYIILIQEKIRIISILLKSH